MGIGLNEAVVPFFKFGCYWVGGGGIECTAILDRKWRKEQSQPTGQIYFMVSYWVGRGGVVIGCGCCCCCFSLWWSHFEVVGEEVGEFEGSVAIDMAEGSWLIDGVVAAVVVAVEDEGGGGGRSWCTNFFLFPSLLVSSPSSSSSSWGESNNKCSSSSPSSWSLCRSSISCCCFFLNILALFLNLSVSDQFSWPEKSVHASLGKMSSGFGMRWPFLAR